MRLQLILVSCIVALVSSEVAVPRDLNCTKGLDSFESGFCFTQFNQSKSFCMAYAGSKCLNELTKEKNLAPRLVLQNPEVLALNLNERTICLKLFIPNTDVQKVGYLRGVHVALNATDLLGGIEVAELDFIFDGKVKYKDVETTMFCFRVSLEYMNILLNNSSSLELFARSLPSSKRTNSSHTMINSSHIRLSNFSFWMLPRRYLDRYQNSSALPLSSEINADLQCIRPERRKNAGFCFNAGSDDSHATSPCCLAYVGNECNYELSDRTDAPAPGLQVSAAPSLTPDKSYMCFSLDKKFTRSMQNLRGIQLEVSIDGLLPGSPAPSRYPEWTGIQMEFMLQSRLSLLQQLRSMKFCVPIDEKFRQHLKDDYSVISVLTKPIPAAAKPPTKQTFRRADVKTEDISIDDVRPNCKTFYADYPSFGMESSPVFGKLNGATPLVPDTTTSFKWKSFVLRVLAILLVILFMVAVLWHQIYGKTCISKCEDKYRDYRQKELPVVEGPGQGPGLFLLPDSESEILPSAPRGTPTKKFIEMKDMQYKAPELRADSELPEECILNGSFVMRTQYRSHTSLQLNSPELDRSNSVASYVSHS